MSGTASDEERALTRDLAQDVVPDLARIEELASELVRTAPDLSAAAITELDARLAAITAPPALPLARAIAEIVGLVAARRIDAGIALPHLAMACATLADGVSGRLGARELEAARYEIETLLPVPGAPAPLGAAPDVPLSALRRKP